MLKAEQKRLYQILNGETRCFVRVCDTDDALWVSDFPRRSADADSLCRMLLREGFACEVNHQTGLCYLDWTEAGWERALNACPHALPALPADERYHPACALCRLWLAHPAQRTPKTLPAVRRVLKLAQEPEEGMLRAVAPLHEAAAQRLRLREAGAYDAGRVLAKWLKEREEMCE